MVCKSLFKLNNLICQGIFNSFHICEMINALFRLELTSTDVGLYSKLIKKRYLNDNELIEVVELLNKIIARSEILKYKDTEGLYTFFEGLLSDATKNNNLGDWSIEKKMLDFIVSKFMSGSKILEFGSGLGTDALLSRYEVVSIEHNIDYAFERSEDHKCNYIPISDGWYDSYLVEDVLKEKFDLLLIDGPPGNLRKGILNHSDLFFTLKSPIIFDDVDREYDKEIMIQFCEKINFNYEIYPGESQSDYLFHGLNEQKHP